MSGKTINEKIRDDMVRHQTYLMRYAGGLRNGATAILEGTEQRIQALILEYSEKLQGVSPISKKGRALLAELQKEIAKIRGEAWEQIQANGIKDFEQYAKFEGAATLRLIEAPFPTALGLQPLTPKQLALIATAQPFEGRTLSEWLKRSEDIDVDRIVRNAKIGIMQGETPTQVARRVLGTMALDRRDGAARKAFRDLESIYLTVTNGINNEVKQQLYAENSDIIKLELFVATLDVRTTLTCASNDGKTFKLGEGPMPPLHFRCRSLRVPYISPDALTTRGFDSSFDKMTLAEFAENNNLGDIRKYADLPRGYKTAYNSWKRGRVRELVGEVPASTTFSNWLKGQTPEFQDEYLGKAKANIFRQGKLPLDKFVTRDGYELTIADLEKLNKAA